MAIPRKDLVIGKAVDTDPAVIPRYNLVDASGNTVAANVELQLTNPILQEAMNMDANAVNELLSASGTTDRKSTRLNSSH